MSDELVRGLPDAHAAGLADAITRYRADLVAEWEAQLWRVGRGDGLADGRETGIVPVPDVRVAPEPAAVTITCPDDFDDADRAYAASLVPEGSFVQGLVSVIWWMDSDGQFRWRCYSQSDAPVSSTLGILEMAKLNVIARSDTGLPIRYDDDDDE